MLAADAHPHIDPDAAAIPWQGPSARARGANPVAAYPPSRETILAQPRFSAARNRHVEIMTRDFGDDPFLNRLLMEAARITLVRVLVALSPAFREDDRRTWPTVDRVQTIMAPFELASRKRIDALIARLVDIGYLRKIRSAFDGRVCILRPTDGLLATERRVARAFEEPVAMLELSPAIGNRHDDGIGPIAVIDAVACAKRHPAVDLFLSHDAGYMVLMAVLQPAMTDRSTDPRAISFSGIGTRLGVSRTHVRHVIQAAERAGLVAVRDRRGHAIAVRPPLWRAFDSYVAEMMSIHARAGNRTAAPAWPCFSTVVGCHEGGPGVDPARLGDVADQAIGAR